MIFGIAVHLHLGQAGNVGQGRRSKVKVKCQKSCFGVTVALLNGQGQRSWSRSKVEIKVMGHGQRSRSNFWSTAVGSTRQRLCSLPHCNKSHYQSKVFVCVSVMWVILRMRSIGFLLPPVLAEAVISSVLSFVCVSMCLFEMQQIYKQSLCCMLLASCHTLKKKS